MAKALRLLDKLGTSDTGTSIAALSNELKMGKSTVHRLLATLREFDLVWFDADTSNYALGARILRWSDLLVRQNLLIRHWLPILRELVETCHETASLEVLEGTEIGGRCPAHCAALGKALLSALSEREFNTVYEGVAYDLEENVSGGVCLGAVVRNHTGKPVAAMSVSMPTQRLRGDILITRKESMVRAPAKLSSQLGHAEGVEAPHQRRRRQDLCGPPASAPLSSWRVSARWLRIVRARNCMSLPSVSNWAPRRA